MILYILMITLVLKFCSYGNENFISFFLSEPVNEPIKLGPFTIYQNITSDFFYAKNKQHLKQLYDIIPDKLNYGNQNIIISKEQFF